MTYVHPTALCESAQVGARTRIWAFAHVLPGARLGRDCNVCDHVFIENDVTVGDRVTIKCGVQLWDGVELGDDVFVGPNVTFTNDKFPRSKHHPVTFLRTRVEDGASLGGGSTILPGLRIGRRAMVGAGAVVTRDVPPYAMVAGNPARIVGYAGTRSEPSASKSTPRGVDEPTQVKSVRGVHLLRFTHAADMRGSLVAADFTRDLPFTPQRVFTVFDVPSRDVRGEHAHIRCEQVLMCLRGSVRCLVDDGTNRAEVTLDRPDIGLYMPAATWGTQYSYTADCVLLVLASLPYDADDYVRDYDTFTAWVGQGTERQPCEHH